MTFDSLRNPATWPRKEFVLRDDSLVYAYASPIDRGTGLIGDIGVTLYRGTEQSIQHHLSRCLEMTFRIARFAEVGMELRELFNYSQKQLDAASLSNQASSFGSGTPNIGHTIPWTYHEYSHDAKECLERGEIRDVQELIREHRVFVNGSAALRIQPTMAFTIEPQIRSSTDPICSYHLIVAFSEGTKSISASFEALFKAFGMNDYMSRVCAETS